MLEISHLTIKVNNKDVIQNFSAFFNAGEKVAVIGEEGNGKSTFLKAIADVCDYAEISGNIQTFSNTVGYLKQSFEEEKDLIVEDYLFEEKDNYYERVADLYRCLNDFSLSDTLLKRKIGSLSGGEKVKIGILRLLLSNADILLLDEPTNDLDLSTLLWLEEFIQSSEKLIIFVSHDEMLLSRCATCILHMEQIRKKSVCRVNLSYSDYDTYVEKRLNALSKQDQMAKSDRRQFKEKQERLNRIMQKVEHQQRTISRGDPHGGFLLKKHMRNLKAQQRKLDQTELTEKVDVEEGIKFSFEDHILPKGKTVLSLHLEELCVEGKKLASQIDLDIYGQDNICIIGNNGVGKSTLIKKMYEEMKDHGDISLGYMPQNYEDQMDYSLRVIDYLAPSGKKEDITRARLYLGNMKFTRDEMLYTIGDISNGSKAKLFLLKFVLDGVNVLLLDEPTRNVSPLSNPVIREALRSFQGCIIAVSHDRKYIEEVPEKVYQLTPDGLFQLQ